MTYGVLLALSPAGVTGAGAQLAGVAGEIGREHARVAGIASGDLPAPAASAFAALSDHLTSGLTGLHHGLDHAACGAHQTSAVTTAADEAGVITVRVNG